MNTKPYQNKPKVESNNHTNGQKIITSIIRDGKIFRKTILLNPSKGQPHNIMNPELNKNTRTVEIRHHKHTQTPLNLVEPTSKYIKK